jgi:hypothetical protein
MRGRPLAQLRLLLGGLAAAGVLVAHLLAYLLIEPQHHHPGAVAATAATHRIWTIIAAAAMGLTIAGLVRLAFDRAIFGGPARTTGALFGAAAVRLVPLQVLGCLGLQAMERLAVGDSFAAELTGQAMLIGPSLQVLVALIGAFFLVLFVKAVELILARWAPPVFSARPSHALYTSFVLPPRFEVGTGCGTVRGPPLLA